MLQVVINGTYYKGKDKLFTDSMGRFKKTCVYFYDYDEYTEFIINQMEQSDIEKLKINIYNKYHKQIKFSPFSEYDVNNGLFEGLKVSSPIIEIDVSDLAELMPKKEYLKRYFVWDSIRERYFFKSDFINYIKMGCLSM